MKTWVALIRGINVGGRNILPMAKLRSDLKCLGLKEVQTYIQSGNVVFQSQAKTAASLAKKIGRYLEQQLGFRPQLLILDRKQFASAIKTNPFTEAVSDPRSLHFFFLAELATEPDVLSLDNAKTPQEHYKLTHRVFYLHAPNGIGRSKLAANAEKYLGVAVTARNYRTVCQLMSMLDNTDA